MTTKSLGRVDRLAVQIVTLKGGSQFLDIDSHVTARRVAVYDTQGKKEIASVPAQTEHNYEFEYELSPDGEVLAILEDNVLRVIDLRIGNESVAH